MANGLKVGLFSGRFDCPNLGHVLTIEQLMSDYRMLLVPILDYPERKACTAIQAKQIFDHQFSLISPKVFENRVRFIVNHDHFGEITKEKLSELVLVNGFSWDDMVYLSGNRKVLDHIVSLGMNSMFVDRVTIHGIDQYMFESTKIRDTLSKTGESLDEYYNISLCG